MTWELIHRAEHRLSKSTYQELEPETMGIWSDEQVKQIVGKLQVINAKNITGPKETFIDIINLTKKFLPKPIRDVL
jgi:hypothetical protein